MKLAADAVKLPDEGEEEEEEEEEDNNVVSAAREGEMPDMPANEKDGANTSKADSSS